MKLPFVLGTVVVGIALTGWAQDIKEAKPLKPHPSTEFKVRARESAKPAGASSPTGRTSSASVQQLRRIEAEHPKKASTTKRLPGPQLQDKQRPASKINFATNNPRKSQLNRKAADPYQGRLKQKGPRH